MEAASFIVGEGERCPSINTKEWLLCGTGNRCFCDAAIDASSSCAVVNIPGLSILIVNSETDSHTEGQWGLKS